MRRASPAAFIIRAVNGYVHKMHLSYGRAPATFRSRQARKGAGRPHGPRVAIRSAGPGTAQEIPPLDRATVAAGDRVRYDPPAMTLHWLTALLVLTLWTLAQAWGFLQHGTPLRHELQALHVSLGLVLIVVLALRIGWRAGPSRRPPPAATGAAELAARAMHYLLYALPLAQVALGLGFRWAGPDPLGFFGLFTIPAPFAFTQQQGQTIAELHQWIGD